MSRTEPLRPKHRYNKKQKLPKSFKVILNPERSGDQKHPSEERGIQEK